MPDTKLPVLNKPELKPLYVGVTGARDAGVKKPELKPFGRCRRWPC